MAKEFMSSMLDELMGRNRDALPTQYIEPLKWDSPRVCPYYLVSFCPHDIFTNTWSDLRFCTKLHDSYLQKKYADEAPNYVKLKHEAEFIRCAEFILEETEKKIENGKMRIALANQPDVSTYAGPGSKYAKEIHVLTDRIDTILKEAKMAECEGDEEKSQRLMKLCDRIKVDRDLLKPQEIVLPYNPDKFIQVCEVCGSFLTIGEDTRLDDHLTGKLHTGFAMLRQNLEIVRKAHEKRSEEQSEKIDNERAKLWLERTKTIRKEHYKKDHWDSHRGGRGHRDRDTKRRKSSPSRDRDNKAYNGKDKYSRERRRSRSRNNGEYLNRDRDRDHDHRSSPHSNDKNRSTRSRSRSSSKRRDRYNSQRSRKRSRSRCRGSTQRNTWDKEEYDMEKENRNEECEDAEPSETKVPKLNTLDEKKTLGRNGNSYKVQIGDNLVKQEITQSWFEACEDFYSN